MRQKSGKECHIEIISVVDMYQRHDGGMMGIILNEHFLGGDFK